MPRCSICRAEGHNKRKCLQATKPATKAVAEPQPEPEYDYPMGEEHQREGELSPAPKPEPQPQPVPKPQPQPQRPPSGVASPDSAKAPNPSMPPLTQKWWVCAYCHLPIGNDHRMCICQAFNYSVDAWKAAAIQYGQELLDAGTHPMS
jgi:hypothetical protein